MNLSQVAKHLAGFALFLSLAQAIPLCHALVEEPTRYHAVPGFAAGLATALGCAVVFWLLGRRARDEFTRRESIATVGIAWFLSGLLCALPLTWAGTLSLTDAFFESVSGLTTTGASVFGSGGNAAVESLPGSIVLWRSLIQWLGGLGIILVFLVLLPVAGVTGKTLLDAEQVGVSTGAHRPSMRTHARRLFRLYLALTLSAALALALAGMNPFEAICHAFTCLATGGFSTRNASIGSFHSPAVEWVTVVFMFLAGCNFTVQMAALSGRLRGETNPLRNPEFRLYLILAVGVSVALAGILWVHGGTLRDDVLGADHDYSGAGRCLRDGFFQAVSILTSTGYSTADFQAWPKPALLLLMLCMLVGGCTGSTAGGIKVARLLVGVRVITHALRLFIRPHRIERIKLGRDVLPDAILWGVAALILMWLVSITAGTLILSCDPRLDLTSAFTANLSALGCTGPAVTDVLHAADGTYAVANPGALDLGPYGGYGGLHSWAKILLAVQMILGRLELLVPLALFSPFLWKR